MNKSMAVAVLVIAVLTLATAITFNTVTGRATLRTSSYYCCGTTGSDIYPALYCNTAGINQYTWSKWVANGPDRACRTVTCEDWCARNSYISNSISEDGLMCVCSSESSV